MESNILLKKKFYGVHKAHNDLDREFRELISKGMTNKEFFRLYNKMFYDLSTTTHNKFLKESVNYAFPEGYKHPKKLEEEALRTQLQEIQLEIDSLEREHFFFKNNRILVTNTTILNNSGNLTNVGNHGPFFMHSGRKRKINEMELYRKLKVKFRNTYQEISDQETVISISEATLNGIPTGPPINGSDDIYISDLEVNIYPLTLEEYEDRDTPAVGLAPPKRDVI